MFGQVQLGDVWGRETKRTRKSAVSLGSPPSFLARKSPRDLTFLQTQLARGRYFDPLLRLLGVLPPFPLLLLLRVRVVAEARERASERERETVSVTRKKRWSREGGDARSVHHDEDESPP